MTIDIENKLKVNIYSYVDEMPEYPGGTAAMVRFINRNKSSVDVEDIQGTLKFEIIIYANGAILDETIPNKEPDAYTESDKWLIHQNFGSM